MAGLSEVAALHAVTNRIWARLPNFWSGPLAAHLFRKMNVGTGTTCTHTVRVIFGDGGRTTRPINFCGKNILYVSNDDIWIE
ncbi:MAG: hypothetical protein V4523_08420 [Pseudomonadota bacterium]